MKGNWKKLRIDLLLQQIKQLKILLTELSWLIKARLTLAYLELKFWSQNFK